MLLLMYFCSRLYEIDDKMYSILRLSYDDFCFYFSCFLAGWVSQSLLSNMDPLHLMWFATEVSDGDQGLVSSQVSFPTLSH